MIMVVIGCYGLYVYYEKIYVNFVNVEEVFEIGLNWVVFVIVDKCVNFGCCGIVVIVLKDLGEYDGKFVCIMSGWYGFYVKYEKINVILFKGIELELVILE